MNEIAWPIWTLEMTPSGATSDSYPIEVGVACWTAPTAAINTWSTPVNPYETSDWGEPGDAFLSQAGITAQQLSKGMTPMEIAEKLNDIFMTSTVHGRSGTIDVHLANRLNLAARVWPTYSLRSWRDICERNPQRGSSAWDIVRTSEGDAAQRACATMRGIALILGHEPSCRSVPTMAVPLPL